MELLENINLDIPRNIGKEFLKKVMGGRLNQQLEKMVENKREICIEAIRPKAIFDYFEIEKIEDDYVYFKSGQIFNGPNISKILTGSEAAIIFIFTLGKKVDELIEETSKNGDTLSTIIQDSITTAILHIAGEYIGKIIKKSGIKKPGWGSTCSYAPGQYKWTIEEQKKIFNMVDGSKIGVNLNASFLMIPFKSISGIYGFGPSDKIDKTRVACDLCPRENCIGRR